MSKQEVEWCKKIEVWWLLRDIKENGGHKHTTVLWGENGAQGKVSVEIFVNSDEKYIRFIYTQTDSYTGESRDFDYKVSIVETPCHLGGSRYWFKCSLTKNNQYCGRRVGVLYKNGNWFGCRHCHNLTYRSRNNNKKSVVYSMFRVLELDTEIQNLEQKSKKSTYKGRITQKRRKLQKLYQEYYQNLQSAERRINF